MEAHIPYSRQWWVDPNISGGSWDQKEQDIPHDLWSRKDPNIPFIPRHPNEISLPFGYPARGELQIPYSPQGGQEINIPYLSPNESEWGEVFFSYTGVRDIPVTSLPTLSPPKADTLECALHNPCAIRCPDGGYQINSSCYGPPKECIDDIPKEFSPTFWWASPKPICPGH